MVSAGAVEKHISNIFAKINLPELGADNRRVLAVLAWLQVPLTPARDRRAGS